MGSSVTVVVETIDSVHGSELHKCGIAAKEECREQEKESGIHESSFEVEKEVVDERSSEMIG